MGQADRLPLPANGMSQHIAFGLGSTCATNEHRQGTKKIHRLIFQRV
jgi:hypothetical protein